MNWIPFTVIVLSGTAILALAETNSGFGYEIVMHSLEAIREHINLLIDSHSKLEQQVNRTLESQSKLEKHVSQLIESQSKLERQFNHSAESQSKLIKELFNNELGAKVNLLLHTQSKLENQVIDHCNATVTKIGLLKNEIFGESKCPETGTNGKYLLKIPHSSPFEVACNKGWITIHQRLDGRLDFNRSWVPYRDGFGDLGGEHWLGLEKMHRITRTGSYDLYVHLKSFDGVVKSARYSDFKIDSEAKQYQVNVGKMVKGDAGDMLIHHNGMKFSTPDRDNDKNTEASCAKSYASGWWFINCFHTNLNGYYKEGKEDSMSWNSFEKKRCLKEAAMYIRLVG